MRVGVGYSDYPDSTAAGKQASRQALKDLGSLGPCDMVLLFCTARHDQDILRKAVADEVGPTTPIYGGGAVGIITNEQFGYAGDQVGVVCVWFEGSSWEFVSDGGLLDGEESAGMRLGKQLAEKGVHKESPVMLFYDAIDQSQGDFRMVMATWLLEGIKKGLGFLPDLTGAGMQGDHVCTPSRQFVGDIIGDNYAMALTFSDDIRVDHAIMHGCRPASGYYTVTKAEGPVILEIDGEPAIPFVDKMLDSSITPEDYPFFLMFGLNHGDRWGEFDENNYASRLCLAIDKERDGIVMFEPDMVAGTEFQLMTRSLELGYMKPKLEEVFERVGDREPVLALYIDCAGRCAGYGGIELEDALVVQEVTAGKVPLLGLYTGVEIAPIGGESRGLDWTGVFCVISKGPSNDSPAVEEEEQESWSETGNRSEADSHDADRDMSLESAIAFAEQNAARALKLDIESIAIRHELEQKRRGFSLLAELSESLRETEDYQHILRTVSQRINAALNMQKTVVLLPDREGRFVPTIMQGYTVDEKAQLEQMHIAVDHDLLDAESMTIVNGGDAEERFADIRRALDLKYFVSAPVIIRNEVEALLITGRMVEAPPFMSRLGHNDAETVQAISALLSTVLIYQRLDAANKRAQTDVLTGLMNREAFEEEISTLLEDGLQRDQMFAYLMVDLDNFNSINDKYGHLQGDIALKTLANAMKNNFRSTDIVARLGGDEFAVFCPSIGKVKQVVTAIDRLMDIWHETLFTAEDGTTFKSTLSIGVSVAPRDGSTYRDLYQKADIALYKSKHQGRDRYTIYNV